MIVAQARPLFAWDCLEDSPSLKTIRDLLPLLPDSPLGSTAGRGGAGPGAGHGRGCDASVGEALALEAGRIAAERVNARLKIFWGPTTATSPDRAGSSPKWAP
jgi:hypothetical protein